ncbi:MAG: hypothetical protein ACOX12_09100 [Eggerthellaceae bacterium]
MKDKMGATEDYLIRVGRALAEDNECEISNLALEIHEYLGSEGTSADRIQNDRIDASANGLRRLRAKLLSRREVQDSKAYDPYGLGAITDSIQQLEHALGAGWSNDELEKLYNRIDHIYANTLDDYVDGLSGWWYTDCEPSDDQTRLRIEKLRYYRDEEYQKLKLAEAQKASVSMTQLSRASAETNVTVSISATIERIDSLPESSLSEDEKTLLKGMIADLADKDSNKRGSKLQKLLKWLSDKGTDVFIAAMPCIVDIIKTQAGV